MKQLTPKFQKELKQAAHHLNPLIIIGHKGLTDSVLAEIETTLTAHELIKIKINNTEKEIRQQTTTQICEKLNATLIQQIGKSIVIWKENPDKKKIG